MLLVVAGLAVLAWAVVTSRPEELSLQWFIQSVETLLGFGLGMLGLLGQIVARFSPPTLEETVVCRESLRHVARKDATYWTLEHPLKTPWVRSGGDSPAITGDGLVDLADTITSSREAAVVVCAPSGFGKTTLARFLQGHSLREDSLVPVYLHVGSWAPGNERFRDWRRRYIVGEAARRGSRLKARGRVIDAALVQPKVIFLVDGIDQVPGQERAAALDEILGLCESTVWLTQSDIIRNEIHRRAGGQCFRLSKLPLSYVEEEVAGFAASPIRDFLRTQLHAYPQVASTLSTPLHLNLARAACQSGANLPLIPSSAPLTEILIEAKVTALSNRTGAEKSDVVKWAGQLANMMSKGEGGSFAWWDAADRVPWWLTTSLMLLISMTFGFLSSRVPTGWRDIADFGATAMGIAAIINAARGDVLRPLNRSLLHSGVVRGMSVITVLILAVWGVPTSESWLALLLLWVLCFLIGFLVWRLSWSLAPETRARLRKLGFRGHLREGPPRRVGWTHSWLRWLAACLAAIAVCYMAYSIRTVNASGDRLVPAMILAGWTFVAILIALSFGSDQGTRKMTARRSMWNNVAFVFCSCILWVNAGFAFIIPIVIMTPSVEVGPGGSLYLVPVASLLAGIVFGGLIGVFCATLSTASRTFVALVWLRGFGLLPRRFDRFLILACDEGVLKAQGFAYSFMHPQVQNWVLRQSDTRKKGQLPWSSGGLAWPLADTNSDVVPRGKEVPKVEG